MPQLYGFDKFLNKQEVIGDLEYDEPDSKQPSKTLTSTAWERNIHNNFKSTSPDDAHETKRS
jgi:hypothetical protein